MARRLIETIKGLGKEVKVYLDSGWQEYVAVPDRNEQAAYHTDDKQDAINTARMWCGCYPVQEHSTLVG